MAYLALHGKPQSLTLSTQAEIECIAQGFKFYAWLYRFLAVLFLLLAPACLVFNLAEQPTASLYWATASLLAGGYLWCISGLGYAGARIYPLDQERGRTSLLAFMVSIIAFLSMFVAAVSIAASLCAWMAPLPNLACAGLLFVVGIGSYMIEIIYLATALRAQITAN